MNQVHFWLLVYFMQILVLLLSESIKGPYTVRCFYATVRNWVSQLSAPCVIIIFSHKTWNAIRTGKHTPNGDVSRRSGVTAPFIFNLVSRWVWAAMIHVPARFSPGMQLWYARLGRKFRVGNRNTVLRKPSQYLDSPSDAQIFQIQEAYYWNAFTYPWKTWA